LSISEEVEAKISDSDRAVGLELFATAAAPRSASEKTAYSSLLYGHGLVQFGATHPNGT
jgi:hypothetical protein